MLAKTPDREAPDRVSLDWGPTKKPIAMEQWSHRVMTDHRLSRSDIKVAFALTYGFNSKSGGCWKTKAALAKHAGLSESAVKQALTDLDRNGHIIRTTETIRGKEMRVIRPSLSRSFGLAEPRKRRGGVAKGIDPRALAEARRRTDVQSPYPTDVQSSGGTDVQAPCILEVSETNPRVSVAGVGTTAPDYDYDDDLF